VVRTLHQHIVSKRPTEGRWPVDRCSLAEQMVGGWKAARRSALQRRADEGAKQRIDMYKGNTSVLLKPTKSLIPKPPCNTASQNFHIQFTEKPFSASFESAARLRG
jgi:hypothetical protein